MNNTSPTTVAAAVAFFDTMTANAEAIAAIESETFIVGMIDGLQAAMVRRSASEYLTLDYVAGLRAQYEARIAVYVEALAIARAARSAH